MKSIGEELAEKKIVKINRMMFFETYLEAVEGLSESEVMEWEHKLLRFGIYGEEPNFKEGSILWRLFRTLRPVIISSNEKVAFGLKGGRPKK